MTAQDPVVNTYAPAISAALLDLFREEDERQAHLFHFDLEEVDATAFFTAVPLALALIMGDLTDQPTDALGVTHTLNRLIAQWNVKRAKGGVE